MIALRGWTGGAIRRENAHHTEQPPKHHPNHTSQHLKTNTPHENTDENTKTPQKKVSGDAHAAGDMAYVPQTPWCQNLSIRDNVLFGRRMDRERYDAVIHGEDDS